MQQQTKAGRPRIEMTDKELDACLAMLVQAATHWENGEYFCAHPVLLGVASPRRLG